MAARPLYVLDEASPSTKRTSSGTRQRLAETSDAQVGAHEELLNLQRLAGNRAVTSVIQRLNGAGEGATRPRRGELDDEEWESIYTRPTLGTEEGAATDEDVENDGDATDEGVEATSDLNKPAYPPRPTGEDRERIIHQGSKPEKPHRSVMHRDMILQGRAVELSKDIRSGPKKREATPASRNQAAKFLLMAHQVQEKITHDVEEAMAPGGGRRAGEEFATKDWTGLADKMAMPDIQKKMKGDFLGAIGDALRFTILYDVENFTDNVLGVFAFLKARGYQPVKVFNTLKDEKASYRGINTNWRSGSGIKWELQFHTPQSYQIKTDVNHDPYEGFRNAQEGDYRAGIIEKRMKKVSARIQTPEGIERIQDIK